MNRTLVQDNVCDSNIGRKGAGAKKMTYKIVIVTLNQYKQ